MAKYEKSGEWYSPQYGRKDKGERAMRGGAEYDRKGKPIYERPYDANKAADGERAFGTKKSYSAKPSGKSEYRGSSERKSDFKPAGKPEYKGSAERKSDFKPAGKPEYKGSAERKSDFKPAGKPEYKGSSDRRPDYRPAARPDYRSAGKPFSAPEPETAFVPDDDTAPLLVFGRNPVKEAIKSGASIDKLHVLNTGAEDGSLRELVRMAREKNLVISQCGREKLDELTRPFGYNGKPANHQGIVAQLSSTTYVELAEIIEYGKTLERPPMVLVLDNIYDPHNLGAIIRSAVCAGAAGVVIPKRRSASVTAAAAKASAGAVMYCKIARVPNLSAALRELKSAGYWIAGADSSGQAMRKCALSGPAALVIGGEDTGISRLLKDDCDFLAAIPMLGQINSLNASAAAAILMYEKLRQDEK